MFRDSFGRQNWAGARYTRAGYDIRAECEMGTLRMYTLIMYSVWQFSAYRVDSHIIIKGYTKGDFRLGNSKPNVLLSKRPHGVYVGFL